MPCDFSPKKGTDFLIKSMIHAVLSGCNFVIFFLCFFPFPLLGSIFPSHFLLVKPILMCNVYFTGIKYSIHCSIKCEQCSIKKAIITAV